MTTVAVDSPSRPALRYHGAKWRLAPWVIGHFPATVDYDIYVEPFAGSAAVLLRKERSPIEVLNDRDSDVVNFFQMLRERRDEMIQAIELTPFARVEWERAGEPTDDPIEQARRFYLRSYASIAGPTAQWRSGWRRQKVLSRRKSGQSAMTSAANVFAKTSHLHTVAERLRGVFIESEDGLDTIRRYDAADTLFYVDPPYPAATRKSWKTTAYNYELTDEMHVRLLGLLNECSGMVVLSGYDCELYRDLLPEPAWRREAVEVRTNGEGSAVESLWRNAAVLERIAAGQKIDKDEVPLFFFGEL